MTDDDDPDLDDVPARELGERDEMYAVVHEQLEHWLIERCKAPGRHLVGTFLDLLAAHGYRVTPIPDPGRIPFSDPHAVTIHTTIPQDPPTRILPVPFLGPGGGMRA